MTTSYIVISSLDSNIQLSRERLGADVIVLPTGASADASSVLFTAQPINVYFSDSVLEIITTLVGIEKATPQFFTQTVDESCCSVAGVTRIVGIDLSSDFLIRPWLIEEYLNDFGDNGIILGSSAPSVEEEKVSILGTDFTVLGTVESTGTSVDETIFMDIVSAQHLAAESPYLQSLWEKTDPLSSLSCVMVSLSDGADSLLVSEAIMEACPGTVAIATSDMIMNIASQMEVIGLLCLAMVVLLIIITSLALTGRVSALVASRRRELGLMRTMGISLRKVIAGVFLETGIVTLASTLCGILIACVVSMSLVNVIHASFDLPGSIPSLTTYLVSAALGLLLTAALTMVAIIQPAIELLRSDPQMILSKEDL